MEKQKSKPEHMLMEAIGFSEEDLEANQQGLISKRQRVRLSNHKNWWLIILVFLGLAACVLVSLTILYTFQSSYDSGARLLIIGFACILVVGFISYAEIKQRRFRNDLHDGAAYVAEGWVRIDVVNQTNRGTNYTVQVEHLLFGINKQTFLAFKNGDPYRIYYAPRSKTILSAEWLREDG